MVPVPIREYPLQYMTGEASRKLQYQCPQAPFSVSQKQACDERDRCRSRHLLLGAFTPVWKCLPRSLFPSVFPQIQWHDSVGDDVREGGKSWQVSTTKIGRKTGFTTLTTNGADDDYGRVDNGVAP